MKLTCNNCNSANCEIIEITENYEDIPEGTFKLCHDCKGSWKVEECEVYSRVVGYLRPIKQWNKGKKEEFKERKEYKI